jgi:AcrR family transcriptional regulator
MSGNSAVPSEDRRVRKTRIALREALVELTLEKGYDAVTVGEIAERADVGRTTFYAHFTDKDNLLLSGFAEFHEATIVATMGGMAALAEITRQVIRHANEEERLYRAVFGYKGAGALHAQLEWGLCQFLQEMLKQAYPTADAHDIAMGARMAATSFLGMIAWWLDSARPVSADELSDSFLRFILPALESQLGAAAK